MIETGFMFALGAFLFIIFLYALPIIIPVCILAAIGLFIYANVDEDSVKKENLAQTAYASSTLCQVEVESTLTAPKVVGWDSTTNVAKYIDLAGETHIGKVTLVRAFNKGKKIDEGEKINLLFEYGRDYFGVTSTEFIVFPYEGKFRIFGAGYITENGTRYLTQYHGLADASCVSP